MSEREAGKGMAEAFKAGAAGLASPGCAALAVRRDRVGCS